MGGRDFNFLEAIMEANINMLFVGDFYQHTFDTSRDGATNSTYIAYKGYFSMEKSWMAVRATAWRWGGWYDHSRNAEF